MNSLVKKAAEAVTTNSAKLVSKIKVHSPEILVGVGIVGVLGATFLACRATLKAEDILDEFEQGKEDIQEALDLMKDPDIQVSSKYTEEDAKKDTTVLYVNLIKGLVLDYGPALAVMGTSIACILLGFGKIKGRHAALIAAYTTLDQSYSQYRQRVRDELGEEKEKEFRYGLKDIINEDTIVGENGKKKKVKNVEKEITLDTNDISPYARFFDETSLEYDSNPEYNMMFLRGIQTQMNDKFKAQGYLFLNDVYDALGLEKSFPMGQMVGWKEGLGDDFVDFGIYNGKREKVRDFVNGLEPAILLDFNVDGVIFDKI